MKYCPSCGTELRPGVKFCPSCGQDLVIKETVKGRPKRRPTTQKKKGSFFTRLLLLAILLAGGYYLVTEVMELDSYGSSSNWVEEVTGTYVYRTSTSEYIKNAEVTVMILSDKVIGRSSQGLFHFDLHPQGRYQFEGQLTLSDIETEVRATYDPAQKKLTFTRPNSPLDLYIEKVR